MQTARSQYDFFTGLLTGFKDRNGVVTQTIYSDPFNRPTLVKAALGVTGVQTHSKMYYAPVTLTEFGISLTNNDVLTARDQTTIDDATLRSWTRTDGFGRTVESWSQDPQGDDKVVTLYDSLGRAHKQSNPFRPSLGETAVYTTTAFDLAGRVSSVTTPDGAVVSTSYSGNTVTVTDQAGKKRKSVTDGLGRLKEIYEDPTGLDYLTSYQYDVLDDLTRVTQDTQPARVFEYDSLKRLRSATNPESGTVCYGTVVNGQCQTNGYDANGNLRYKTDARGIRTTYDYDALNRNTTVDYLDTAITPDVTRVYDNPTVGANGKGRLWESYAGGNDTSGTNVEHAKIQSYDALGRPLDQRQRFKLNGVWSVNGEYRTQRTYNLAGAVTWQSYPSGHEVFYAYDSAGRTNNFNGSLGGTDRTYSTGIIYSPMGGMTKEQFGTDTAVYQKLAYNSRGQLAEIRASTSYTGPTDTDRNRGGFINWYSTQCGGAICNNSENNGNLRRQDTFVPHNDQANPSTSWYQEFHYDSLNRLQWMQESGLRQEYVYDRWGNRTIHQGNTWGGAPMPNFGVNANNNRLTAPAGYTMSYDDAGNLTNDTYTGQGQRNYDAENRMTAAQGGMNGGWQYYSYNADGQRVRRKVDNTETWQVYGIDGELLAEYAVDAGVPSLQKEYGYRNGQLLITAAPHPPPPSANTIGAYDPASGTFFLKNANTPGNADLVFGFGGAGWVPVVGDWNGSPDEFKGGPEELFGEVDPHDPVFYAEIAEPQSLNKYHYCLNNPLRFIDPDGHQTVMADILRTVVVANVSGRVNRGTIARTVNGAASAFSENNGFGSLDARQNRAGRAAGHILSLAVAGAEVAVGVQGIVGGGGEAVLTSPAAGTGVGALLPAVRVATAVAGVTVTAHGGAVIVNTLVNIFSKGKDGHPPQDSSTVEGTQDKLNDIEANQANQRKVGQGAGMESIEGTKQKAKTQLKKVKRLEDVEPE